MTDDEADPDEPDAESGEPTPESIETRLDSAAESLTEADTEAALDDVAETFDEIESAIEAAEYPEPDDDEDDPREAATDRLAELREQLEEARGPYAAEVAEGTADSAATIRDTRWTDDGRAAIAEAVGAFLAETGRTLGELPETADPDDLTGVDADRLAEAVAAASEAIGDSGLDPDADAEAIAALQTAAEGLHDAIEAAEEFDDLTTRDQLRAEGFFDVLGHYKDFPVEWAALKEHEQQGNTEMVLLALEKLDSEFLERHCMESLTRMNDETAFEPVHARAQKRDRPAIEALGKMAADDAVETLTEYVSEASNPQLQKVTFTALGEIGASKAVQPLADQLAADNDEVRPLAARALGMIGDTRAIRPLADTLQTDTDDSTRAAAAWALRQIGTREALEHAARATTDDSYIVQAEAERAADALGSDEATV